MKLTPCERLSRKMQGKYKRLEKYIIGIIGSLYNNISVEIQMRNELL